MRTLRQAVEDRTSSIGVVISFQQFNCETRLTALTSVGMAGKQFGQNFSREQEEKYSDMIRQGFVIAPFVTARDLICYQCSYTKGTGSDIPIKDQNPN